MTVSTGPLSDQRPYFLPIFEGDAALHLKKISKIFCSLLDNRRAQKNPIERGRHRDRCRGIEYPYGKERSSGYLL